MKRKHLFALPILLAMSLTGCGLFDGLVSSEPISEESQTSEETNSSEETSKDVSSTETSTSESSSEEVTSSEDTSSTTETTEDESSTTTETTEDESSTTSETEQEKIITYYARNTYGQRIFTFEKQDDGNYHIDFATVEYTDVIGETHYEFYLERGNHFTIFAAVQGGEEADYQIQFVKSEREYNNLGNDNEIKVQFHAVKDDPNNSDDIIMNIQDEVHYVYVEGVNPYYHEETLVWSNSENDWSYYPDSNYQINQEYVSTERLYYTSKVHVNEGFEFALLYKYKDCYHDDHDYYFGYESIYGDVPEFITSNEGENGRLNIKTTKGGDIQFDVIEIAPTGAKIAITFIEDLPVYTLSVNGGEQEQIDRTKDAYLPTGAIYQFRYVGKLHKGDVIKIYKDGVLENIPLDSDPNNNLKISGDDIVIRNPDEERFTAITITKYNDGLKLFADNYVATYFMTIGDGEMFEMYWDDYGYCYWNQIPYETFEGDLVKIYLDGEEQLTITAYNAEDNFIDSDLTLKAGFPADEYGVIFYIDTMEVYIPYYE